MSHLGMSYSIKNRANKMARGGKVQCAHGGPAYCNAGCYAEGGVAEEMHPMHDSMQAEDAEASEKEAMDYEEAHEEPMKMSKGGFLPAHNMAKMIMAKKMATGGMVKDSEEAWDEGEEHEPMGSFDAEDNEAMPLDHATEMDDRLTPADDSEDEQWEGKKKDLLTRIMSRMR